VFVAPLVVCCAIVMLAGCGEDNDTGASSDTSPTTTSQANGDDAANAGDAAEGNGGGALPEVRAVDTGLRTDAAVTIVAAPDGDALLVAERGGRVVQADPDGEGLQAADQPVIDVTDRVGSTDGERGLLGLAVAPDGGHLYLSYTEARDGASQVDEFTLSETDGTWRADPDSRRNLLDVEQPFANHNGGHIEFGPDGMLYVGLGDGGSGGDPGGRAQDPTSLLGKMLRLDPSIDPPVPADNPFVGDDELDARDEIWATGLRNPWRFSFDRENGDLWIADVGQNEMEEINRLRSEAGGAGGDAGAGGDVGGRGANFGWDLFEGDLPFDDADPAPGAASEGPFVEPLFTYGRDQGCSVTGGVVYRGTAIPELTGRYLYSDFCAQGVRVLSIEARESAAGSEQLTEAPGGIIGFGQDRDGEVFVLGLEQGVFRLVPA